MIVVIVGPTAVGKSALAVEVARRFNGEIISADSRQVYRGLDIGTGKITQKEMRGVSHHLLDIASPRRQFSAAEYQRLARQKITEIISRGKLPIVVGGTGLYIDALLGKLTIPEVPPNLTLRKRLEEKSTAELFAMLQERAPERAAVIDRYNPRRLVRALEIAYAHVPRNAFSNSLTSLFYQNKKVARPRLEFEKAFRFTSDIQIGLTLPPDELRRKIAERLAARIRRGMVAEAERLHARGVSWKRMEELGLEYRYLSRYLRGYITKDEMRAKLQTEIYRYAKRQMRWFKRNADIHWFAPSHKRAIFDMLKRTVGD